MLSLAHICWHICLPQVGGREDVGGNQLGLTSQGVPYSPHILSLMP